MPSIKDRVKPQTGLHVSIIGMGFYKMLQKQRVPLLLRSTLSAVAILVFAVLSGAGVSTKRAVLMFLLLLFGGVIGRSYDSLTGLALAAIFLLWENPFVYAYTGFILSFLAVLGVDASVILLKSMDIQKGIREQICVSGCIQAFTIPVIAYCYFELPTYVIFINLLILPTTGAVLFLGILGGLLGLLHPVLGFLPLQGAKGMLMLYQLLCKFFLKLPGAVWVTGQPKLQRLVFYYVVLAGILAWLWYEKKPQRKSEAESNNRVRNLRFNRIALTLFYLGLLICSMQKEEKRFQIQVLDVGQGDGIYIESDAGTEIFVDGGSVDVSEVGKYRIRPFLKSHGVREVDYWFVSHCDADHCNGLMELLETDYPIKHLVFSKYVLKDEAQEELAALAKQKGCQVLYMEEGECFRDTSIRIQAIYPSEKSVEGERNADSLVLLLEHGNFHGLLTGDIGSEQEKKLIETYGEVCDSRNIDWYKAAHHGSKTSNSKELLDALQPKIATISCGQDNSYGHPGKEAVEHMQDAGAEIFQTTECGQIGITEEDGIITIFHRLA
ncbi:MAG: ComEC/Rec2 family competence protein [Lachnospiraceae bacterium]|nr:ComEC/Rec2 family competence protein [Lachnospiraceae bacterium]